MENPIKMDDVGGKKPYFWVNTHMLFIEEVNVCDSNSVDDVWLYDLSPGNPAWKFGQKLSDLGFNATVLKYHL